MNKTHLAIISLFVFFLSTAIQAEITHRWSFNDGTTEDSIGGAHGVLVNNTGNSEVSDGTLTLANDGSQSSDDNDGDYLDLPNGIISSNGDQATFEFWVSWTDQSTSTWAELMSFGTSNNGEDTSSSGSSSTYIMITPKHGSNSNGTIRSGYKYGVTGVENHLNHSSQMPLNEMTHIAVSWDGNNSTTSLYVNGELSDQNSIHFSIADDLIDNNNWLGRSQWDDPMFGGTYDEVRIYNQALSAADIMADYLLGTEITPARSPSPAHGSIGISENATLSWTSGSLLPGNLTGYSIYFGIDENAVRNADTNDSSGIYRGTINASQTSYTPPETFTDNNTYFWRIDQHMDNGIVVNGAIWNFQTPQKWQMKHGRMMTPWSENIDPENILPEYPRPQMVRNNWLNLNGLWQFKIAQENDPAPFGIDLMSEILVPFPVESPISGIMEHHSRFFYRNTFNLPAEWSGQDIILNFEASDWETEVYINGTSVGMHRGGYDPFSFNITEYLNPENPQEIIVRIYDPTNNMAIPRGKQVLSPGGIWYTPNSGIWNTVWLEPVNSVHIRDIKLVPNVDDTSLAVSAVINVADTSQYNLRATAKVDGQTVGTSTGSVITTLEVVLNNLHLWGPSDPFLYDLEIELLENGQVIDHVDSYFGMRKVELQEYEGAHRIFVNEEFEFQIGPLDQGYWPDGIYRAPTDEALKWDIQMVKEFGYNMLRKHVKVEPRRWYYWADKLGVLVWQDMPSGNGPSNQDDRDQFITELEQLVTDHWNSPSIIMWIVFNEGWGQHDTVELTEYTMALDPSRLVSCASGWTDYPVGHIIDYHGYPSASAPPYTPGRAMVSGEYGGIGMFVEDHVWDPTSWGYTMVENSEELENYYGALYSTFASFIKNPGLSAGVYTQITDVEVEINGLITYDRKVIKADPARIREIHKLVYANYHEVIPTSEQSPLLWKYTFDEPTDQWFSESYNDSSWDQGLGGFGTSGTPGAIIGTTWDSSDIWLRREFLAPELTDTQIARLQFRIHHDEDAEIYLNGVLAANVAAYSKNYYNVEFTEAGKDAYKPAQINTLAVHCHQTGGGQFIDVGIQYRDCLCTPGECFDLTSDNMITIEDLSELAKQWLAGYNLEYFGKMAKDWLECK